MKQVAIYARVSGDRQVREETVASQLAVIRERVQADHELLTPADVYVDEGVSGSLLIRPALEQLRDRAADGRLDRLYIYHPDRLARKAAHQAVLAEEFARAGVEVVFLKGGTADTPEGALLVQVQGVIAEYERANILERTRRGRLYRARAGHVSVLAGAPYGYRYIRRSEGATARYEVVEEEVRIVQRIFHELVNEGRPLSEIGRRLQAEGIPTRTRKGRWNHAVIWQMVQNPAYMGLAAYGKRRRWRRETPPPRGRLRPAVSLHGRTSEAVPSEKWIRIAVPAIISEELFEAAGHRLKENRRFALRNAKPGQHLLRGLVVCSACRYGCYAVGPQSASCGGGPHRIYYRCHGRDAARFGGKAVCPNRPVRADALERTVWKSVEEYLRDPNRLVQEFRRRQEEPTEEKKLVEVQREAAERALEKSRRAVQRLVDAYEAGIFTIEEIRGRIEGARQRVGQNEEQLRKLEVVLVQRQEWEGVITHISEFASRVESGLASLDAVERQKLVRLVVDRVEVGPDSVTIVHRIPFGNAGSAQVDAASDPIDSKQGSRGVG